MFCQRISMGSAASSYIHLSCCRSYSQIGRLFVLQENSHWAENSIIDHTLIQFYMTIQLVVCDISEERIRKGSEGQGGLVSFSIGQPTWFRRGARVEIEIDIFPGK